MSLLVRLCQLAPHTQLQRHSIKVGAGSSYTVEEVALAVGEVVRFESNKSASQMNSAVVIFLEVVRKVKQVVECGVFVRENFTPVFPLVSPAKKIMVSNTSPFIKNEALSIKIVLLGCKSPKLKHVACHRRYVYMLPKGANSHLNLTLTFKVEGFNYVVFVTSETMKCFGCGAEEHLIQTGGFGLGLAGGGGRWLGTESAGERSCYFELRSAGGGGSN